MFVVHNDFGTKVKSFYRTLQRKGINYSLVTSIRKNEV